MPNDNESPDHAGLTDAVKLEILQSADRTYKETVKHWASSGAQAPHLIAAFGVGCWAKGVASQSAELATLRGDRAELNLEINRLATQEQELKATLETMKYWMAIDKCDCDTERKDGHTVRMDYPKSLELEWHLEDCEYFSCLRQLLAG